jgi:phosphate transport system permease protein
MKRSIRNKEFHPADRYFLNCLRLLSWGLIAIIVLISLQLLGLSQKTLLEQGARFFWTSEWNPVTEIYGALPFIAGTLITSGIALLIAAPISIGVALFLTEVLPESIAKPIGFMVEMLAAIPSIVYGLWGIFVLGPLVRNPIQPFFEKHFPNIEFLQGFPLGVGVFTASIVLAIMILPTIASISREIFKSVPDIYREGALALGATRSEMMVLAVLKTSKSGIMGAIILGLARAFGETMAVTMVIGNRNEVPLSLFEPAQTMASLIANEYAEAQDPAHISALATVGLTLLILSVIVHTLSRIILKRGFKNV